MIYVPCTTVGTLGEGRRCCLVMRSTLSSSRIRLPSFGMCHCLFDFIIILHFPCFGEHLVASEAVSTEHLADDPVYAPVVETASPPSTPRPGVCD